MIRHVVAAIAQRSDGKVLLLKRSPTRRISPNKWSFVNGYIEPDELPEQAAIRELGEELGITGIAPSASGKSFKVPTPVETIYVYPFLFKIGDAPFRLDSEHSDYAWITPQEVYQYDCVPQLDEDLIAVGLLD